MIKEIISTPDAPAAIGPYSQAVKANGFLFVSGQIPIVPALGEITAADISGQTKQSLENIGAILKEAGLGFENVVKTTVYLKSIKDFLAMNKVYAEYFSGDCPARAAFEVVNLPKNALVEIECMASY